MGERQTHIREWLLDPTQSYEPLSNHRLVNTEVEFLHAFSSGETLLIQGPRLCRWAQNVARARHIPWRELVDPIAVILNIVSSFTGTDARSLLEKLGDRIWEFDTNHSLNCEQLVVWLDEGGPWYGPADVNHALSWLAWWAETQDAQVQSLAALVGQRFADSADDPSLRDFFSVASRDEAFEQLEVVLRLNQDVSSSVTLLSPPVLNSSLSQELFERFKARISKQPPTDDFSLDDIPVQLRYRVADAIAVQAKARGSVSTRLYEKLKRVLGPKGVERLAEFIPVPVPGSVPFDPADVLTWYERSYLPWRTHPTMDPERARVTQSEFESWVLDQHPNMRTHPDNMALLGWVRVDRLQQSDRGTGITLLVIADGLGIDDIDRMKRTISQTDKLMISRSEYVFTQIPTVTDLTKPIIVNGDLSSKSVEENGDKITRLDEVIRRLRVAKSGDFLAWTHAQPDHAYHFTSGKHEGANQVGAQLDVISKGIVDLFEQLPHLDLRVILTTDHGRFHGKGTRLLVAPPGLNPHGRAAWGQTSRSLNSIYESRDGMVWLNPHSYGLTPGYSYVVALGDSMFTTSDSKGGSEWYPHGGLSPEEVIVPWVEICRQSAIRNLFVEISGSGTAHKTGTLVLNIANPNEVPVKLVSCAVSSDSSERVGDSPDSAPPFMPIDMPLNFVSIPELNSKHIPVEISSWPFTKPNENVVGRLVYQLPSGEERSVSVSASIATQSMYNPTLTLDDLEDL